MFGFPVSDLGLRISALTPLPMRALTEFFNRILALFRSRKVAREVDAELEQHLEFMIADYVSQGMSPAEARRRAMLKFGNVEKHKEDARDSWGNRVLLDFLRNFRFGIRLCTRYPESSILGIIVLGLGIGISTILFTVSTKFLELNAGGKIDSRQIYVRWEGKGRSKRGPTTQEFTEFRRASKSLERLVGVLSTTFSFHPAGRVDEERQVDGVRASDNFFEMTDEVPLLGRSFSPGDLLQEEFVPIVIADSLWNEFYDRDPAAVGSVALVNGQARRIIGVMPVGFAFPRAQQIWMPDDFRDFASLPSTESPWINVYGTLGEDVVLEQAQAELSALGAAFLAAHPNPSASKNEFRLQVTPLRQQYLAAAPMLFLTAGTFASILVLLLCASNVFHVIMARTARRGHELATRCSLGAPRSHVVAQVLIDGVTLSLIGALLGLGLAKLGIDAITRQLMIFDLPGALTFQLNFKVVLFALFAAVFTGAVSAFIPAWRASRIDAFAVLKDDSHSTDSIHASRLSRGLLTFQVGSSALLLWIGLVPMGVLSLVEQVGMSFNPESVLTAKLQLRYDAGLRQPTAINQFAQRLEDRLKTVPGIDGVAMSSADFGLFAEVMLVDMDAWEPTEKKKTTQVEVVSPGLLDVYGKQPLAGRMLSRSDTKDSRRVCVVNEDFVRKYFPNDDPVGRVLKLHKRRSEPQIEIAIVGIVPDIKPKLPPPLGESVKNAFARIYLPFAQKPVASPTVLIGADGASSHQFARALREAVRELSPDVRIRGRIMTISERMGIIDSVSNMICFATQAFGVVVLITAIIGLYSIISFTTGQRRREIGIRVALGASGWDVVRAVMRPWIRVLGIGLAIGGTEICVVMFALQFFNNDPGNSFDGLQFALSLGIVWTAVIIACLVSMAVPVWRAARLRPMEAISAD
jgi:predicted permease